MAPLRTILAIVLFILLAACTKEETALRHVPAPVPETEKTGQHHPFAADDLDRGSLVTCAGYQKSWLLKQPVDKQFPLSGKTVSRSALVASIDLFLKKLAENPSAEELAKFIDDNFLVFQAAGRQKNDSYGKMLVTGYYEPIFRANIRKTDTFRYPIYAVPPSLKSKSSAQGTKLTGRYDKKGKFVKFWTRREIETTGVIRGAELAYLQDPFDAFLLHVQGAGKLRFPDGSIRAVRFDGANGLEYTSIGKLLVDEGKMALADVNVPALRRYLEEHPGDRERILFSNPRYIFFAWGDDTGPRGSSHLPLTPGRSVAIDNAVLPPGSIGYLTSTKPVVDQNGNIAGWEPFSRFVFPQDTGSAIKGPGRIDIFWGNGQYAETAANYMKQEGTLFFLIKK